MLQSRPCSQVVGVRVFTHFLACAHSNPIVPEASVFVAPKRVDPQDAENVPSESQKMPTGITSSRICGRGSKHYGHACGQEPLAAPAAKLPQCAYLHYFWSHLCLRPRRDTILN